MPVSIGLSSVTLNESGSIDVLFSDSNGQTFENLDNMKAFCDDVDASTNGPLVQKMLLRWWLLRDALAQSPGIAIGKTLTFDLSQPLSIEVS